MEKGHFHPSFFGIAGPYVSMEEQGDFMTGIWTAKLEFDLASDQGRHLHDVSKNGIHFKELLKKLSEEMEFRAREYAGTPKAEAYLEVISLIKEGARERKVSELLIREN